MTQPTFQVQQIDHDLAWSIYFCDPYGHLYEITTYNYDFIRQNL